MCLTRIVYRSADGVRVYYRVQRLITIKGQKEDFKVSDVQMVNFFVSGKVLKTICFLKGNTVDNSNLILLGLEKQRGMTFEA